LNEIGRAVAKLGVHRIPVAVPFLHAGGPANAYVIEEAGGSLLMVDTGLSAGDGAAALDAGFQRLGFRYEDVRAIVLTHGHVDHFGGARHVQERAGRDLPVLAHPLDAAKISEGGWVYRERAPAYARHLARLGVPGELAAKVMAKSAPAFELARHVPRVEPLADGERFRGRGVELRVVHSPGHTPGLVVLHDPERRLLLSGDHLLEHISPNPLIDLGPADEPGWFRPLVAYEESIRRIRDMELDAVLPGHGPPFTGHRRVIDSLLAFQGRRQARLLALLAAGPRTPWELSRELFPKAGPDDLFLTVSETVANLEVLEARGDAARDPGAEPWRYARSR
jgi:glyoxylase-like metal-dependent hydrolase (beta-lactamase superfamily II)